MIESRIQAKIRDALIREGCLVFKQQPPPVGVPDLLIVYSPGKLFWIEVKQPGKKPSARQLAYHKLLKDRGEYVCVCTNEDQALECLRSLRLSAESRRADSEAPQS